MPHALAARLKEATRAMHTAAERSAFIGDLLRGHLDAPAYAVFLRQLHALYAALEAGLARHAAHPCVAPLQLGPLARTATLAADLAAFDADGRTAGLPLAAATQAYASRLRNLADEAPDLLCAHAYVRYLGDLNGGRLLRDAVVRRFGETGRRGTAFYAFGDDAAGRAALLRAGLDALPLAPEAADAVVTEACEAFRRHVDLFAELPALSSRAPRDTPA